MTNRTVALEVFSTESVGDADGQDFGSELADLQLASYERGYAAGWEDCDAKLQKVSVELRDSVMSELQKAIGTQSTIAAQCAAKAAAMVAIFLDRMSLPIRDSVVVTALEDSLSVFLHSDADRMRALIADPDLQMHLSDRLREKLHGVTTLAPAAGRSSQVEMFGAENGVHLDLADIDQRIDGILQFFVSRADLTTADPSSSQPNGGH